jgi:hypothetical protein
MNEQLLAQIINGMKMNQEQGAVGNVSNNELARFAADPMNYTDAINAMRAANNTGGAVGNVSDNEMSMFNMMAGNAMTGANIGGNVGNVSDNEAAVMAQAVNEMKALQAKGAAGNGILTTDELNRFVYLRNMLNPNLPQEEPVDYNTMPVDIDGASAGDAMTPEELNNILNRMR